MAGSTAGLGIFVSPTVTEDLFRLVMVKERVVKDPSDERDLLQHVFAGLEQRRATEERLHGAQLLIIQKYQTLRDGHFRKRSINTVFWRLEDFCIFLDIIQLSLSRRHEHASTLLGASLSRVRWLGVGVGSRIFQSVHLVCLDWPQAISNPSRISESAMWQLSRVRFVPGDFLTFSCISTFIFSMMFGGWPHCYD